MVVRYEGGERFCTLMMKSQSFSGLESLGCNLQRCFLAFFSPSDETGSLECAGVGSLPFPQMG